MEDVVDVRLHTPAHTAVKDDIVGGPVGEGVGPPDQVYHNNGDDDIEILLEVGNDLFDLVTRRNHRDE